MTNGAIGTTNGGSGKPALNEHMETILDSRYIHTFYNVSHKSLFQQQACGFLTQTAAAHVKDLGSVKLSYGSSVGALHIIVIDFKLRFGIHTRLVGAYEIAVSLISVSLCGAFTHKNSSGESAHSLIIDHILEELIGIAVSYGMVNVRISVETA